METAVRHTITLYVNGQRYGVSVEARHTLADVLRGPCGLTGTHIGCEHGVCGACTVLLDGAPVRSCLLFAVQCERSSIRTVEGLQGDSGSLHPLQEAFRANHGLQCGFCTPGFLMVAASVLENDVDASVDEIRDALASNICRCTGYRDIVTSVLAAQAVMRDGSADDDVARDHEEPA